MRVGHVDIENKTIYFLEYPDVAAKELEAAGYVVLWKSVIVEDKVEVIPHTFYAILPDGIYKFVSVRGY